MAKINRLEPGPAAESARAVFLAWERLRIAYNIALIAVVLIVGRSFLVDREFWSFLVSRGVMANLCFCLGPVLEGYLTLLGGNPRVVRWVVFIPGALFAFLSAFVSVFSYGMPRF